MNDVKRYSALTPTVPPSADGTPPDRQIPFPLTPPATSESQQSTSDSQSRVSVVLDFIRQRQRYNLTGQSIQLKVKQLEYNNLLARLEELPDLKRFANDKLRLEYDPLEETLYAPRMPTTIHDSFSQKVSKETIAQLDRIACGKDEAARFAAGISSVRSGSLQLREFDSDDDIEIDYIERQPDDQFQHEEAEYPGVVYEIGCSQDRRKLAKSAWTYIPYSNGDIKAVVGFELGYGKNKEARISMWQPCYLREDEEGPETLDVETVIDGDLFRSSDGSTANTARTLHLPLDYFATSEVATLEPEGLPGVTITYANLLSFWIKQRDSNE
ncbi:hypothetical protein V502_01229 [Pseudogymnoascus sp. VKM F-4520 (FW-2644)]|nr:hypothetical protein V502_01229 [Pseudogymnoascus sp. VKM F-4520 (FW-2644)]